MIPVSDLDLLNKITKKAEKHADKAENVDQNWETFYMYFVNFFCLLVFTTFWKSLYT